MFAGRRRRSGEKRARATRMCGAVPWLEAPNLGSRGPQIVGLTPLTTTVPRLSTARAHARWLTVALREEATRIVWNSMWSGFMFSERVLSETPKSNKTIIITTLGFVVHRHESHSWVDIDFSR